MNLSEEHQQLLQMVVKWFSQSEQTDHYAQEALQGPTQAERYLLQTLPESGSVLDLGCGAGRIALYMAEQGYQVTGTDVSESLLAAAQEIAGKQNLPITFVRTEGTAIPFPDEQFDMLIGFKVLCYIPTKELRRLFLQECSRVLKPGGHFVLTQQIVPDEYLDDAKDEYFFKSPASRFSILEEGDHFPLGSGYVHWFTEKSLLNELRDSGLGTELFVSDEEHGGAGYLRLIKLRKPSAPSES
jgi:ubiquinone/menaquinone biosynthesis C-methylase UbiE